MGFWTLFEVASMPVLQVLIISILGAFMATGYCNLLNADARRYINKLVFVVFTPALMFASLAKTVTLEDIISWWFMPVNIGLTFLFGGILGWIVVKILKPEPHLEGLVIATCSAGNLGNLLLIIVPAICNEDDSPFGDQSICGSIGLSYASFSMALGGFFIWSYTYHLVRSSAMAYKALQEAKEFSQIPNKDLDANGETHLLKGEDQEQVAILVPSTNPIDEDTENQYIVKQVSAGKLDGGKVSFWDKLASVLHQIVEELLAPPTIAAIVGFIFGATPWLLCILSDCRIHLWGNPMAEKSYNWRWCSTAGIRSARIKPLVIIGIVCVRYVIMPVIGMGVVKAAGEFGFLPSDPLYRYVLMVQFTLPPAMNIGTMTQLFDVGQEECSVLFLWTYLMAALALTVWSTVYMWILS
ncbi:hypothetical protein HHK36_010481 [Tetracentron sinense]|uniref:Uncharacterized protein n=1 Tax=Tetracentron sinense TaxID=13715 RepID=A0A835DMM0_TETSI|nr:hypothetical protein HHK36_010481 [Tetracentron sinense]